MDTSASDAFRRYARPTAGEDLSHPRESSSLRRVDELVGGTLASQEYASRLKVLAERADGFDEKVLNLTRLVQLAQGLAAEREETLRHENDELRSRLKRQEQTTARLQQELESLKSGLPQQMHVLFQPALEAQSAAHEAAVAALRDELTATRATIQQASDEQARQREAAATHYTAELDATREWIKRNLQRLKQHVDAANDAVADVAQHQEGLTSGLQRVECKAEVEYKKLRLLLQKRTKESEALMALLDRELVEVHKVAKNHRVLQSSDIDLYEEEEEVMAGRSGGISRHANTAQ